MTEGCPVILIKCIAKLPYNKDVVFEAIANLEIRKQWDSVFSELKVVNYFTNPNTPWAPPTWDPNKWNEPYC